jgi:hypothetical protein
MRSAGTGLIIEVLPAREDGIAVYKVAKTIRGEAAGVELVIADDELYRTRSLDHDNPLPEQLS